jgi:transketolase
MRNAFAETFLKLARKDSRLVLITGDLGFGVLEKIADELPAQFINSGIAEQSMMSMAAGLASEGFRPFVYSIANFPTLRCLEQIRNDVCYMENAVTIVSVGAGLGYGNLGYTHHAIEDLAIMRALPNIDLYSPADKFEVIATMQTILELKRPSYLRLGKGGEPILHSKELLEITGYIEIITGTDGFLIFTGGIGARVLEAANLLNAAGYFPSVISSPRLTPNLMTDLAKLTRNSFVVTIEEHNTSGGFGSWLLEASSEIGANNLVRRMGLAHNAISLLGSQTYLLDEAGLKPEDIADKFMFLANHYNSLRK